ncbi:MAG: Rpn family recombination-promoting nuclease/putative transposase [Puniceicoccales bacterium]|jgi:hypothetical protein|nr:Rpn family recombination-promoting nuclease/putative transposase [Puniceicoccales bacterium]
MSYLSPKADVTFKKVFADPQHKERCISLLNALLPLRPDQKITDIEFESGELLPRIKPLKNTIVDVQCTDSTGRKFIVEMQMEWTTAFKNRILLNASKAIVSQVDIGESYDSLRPVYSLNFINEIFDNGPDYYHSYGVYEKEHPDKQIEGLEFVLVELPKFKAKCAGAGAGATAGEAKNGAKTVAKASAKNGAKTGKKSAAGGTGGGAKLSERDLWLRFLTSIDNGAETVPPELRSKRELRDAVECLQRASYTKEQLFDYDRYWDSVSVEKTLVNAMKRRMRDTTAKALAKGLAEGHAKGHAKGRAEGRAEGKVEIARQMKADGEPSAKIARYTGLTVAEVKAL